MGNGALSASCRTFYSGLDESRIRRLRSSNVMLNRPRGRDTLSMAFEKRVRLVPLTSYADLYTLPSSSHSSVSATHTGENAKGNGERPMRVLVVDLMTLEAVEARVPFPSLHPLYYTGWPGMKWKSTEDVRSSPEVDQQSPFLHSGDGFVLHAASRNQLRQNGDTTLLRGAVEKCSTQGLVARFSVAICIDPFLDVERFRREEAQVEMISAYRNILYEAAELPGGPADILRVPALSCDTCGRRFMHEIGKLNQQSVIKGFHRISSAAKETLIVNSRFTVELYVLPHLLPQFERAFLEDAWETPESTISPGRTSLYPGLPPPRSLLELDGWVGKRPELVEAIKTEGQSLMSGTQYALDGSAIQPREVMTDIRVFGREKEQAEMLQREQETAVQQGLAAVVPDGSAVAPLQPGIQQS
ncbi:hypothetical protein TRVL_02952 [Trypanosoma vivax]|nr:hypothetical protein TRVL_02952 [Trypanosoma vivax]